MVVYAGQDPLTKRRHYLHEVIPAGPRAALEPDNALRRLAVQVDEQRNPRTTATVEQLLAEHFELLEVEPSTLSTYRTLERTNIVPVIGKQKVGALRAAVFDSMRSFAAVARIATAGPSSSTARRASTTATTGAARTAAAACPGRPSGRSTSSSAAP